MTVTGGAASEHESRRTVASYSSYEGAERAVSYLAERGFPVQRITIVGRGLGFVERVVGPTSYGSAALEGAVSGALVGGALGLLFGLLSIREPLENGVVLTLYGFGLGALLGAAFGALAHALRARRFASAARLEANRYHLLVDSEVADHAELLALEFPDGR